MAKKINVGLIGCGNISSAYLEGVQIFDILEITACSDIEPQKAEEKAAEYNIPTVCSVEELLADPGIDLVLNLTVPRAHAEINLKAIRAGKHVYCEKPLAVTRKEGQEILEEAKKKGVRVGAAPDTFLGGGLQTCRKLIDDGWIGRPVAATAFVASHGPEGWHPNPGFFYQFGGGPLFDMGPYYLTALVHLLGPIRRVTGSAQKGSNERIITNEVNFGKKIPVEIPTHVAGVLDFQSGVVGTMIASFDVWSHHLPVIEIYGTQGTLAVPDPNGFGGPVLLRRAGAEEWSDIPLTHSPDVHRGIGLADMAAALRSGGKHRASGELAFHVLDAMQAFGEASESGKHILLESTCTRPDPLPMGLLAGQLDGGEK